MRRRFGVELELLAPRGASRKTLIDALAGTRQGSRVETFLHAQAEPSKAPGVEVFENLTQGFVLKDRYDRWLCKCVDDITLVSDLDVTAPPRCGWYRVVSDDRRLLRLVQLHGNANGDLRQALQPVADLFASQLETFEDGGMRLGDEDGSPILLGALLPGERERPCELITAPSEDYSLTDLSAWLGSARELGFALPAEAATHLHFDASDMRSARFVARLVEWFAWFGEPLKMLVGTNPRCVRLGRWPRKLLKLVRQEGFTALGWDDARVRLLDVGLTKFCDFNLRNFVQGVPDKNTFEIRILPGTMDVELVRRFLELFSAILDLIAGEAPLPLDKRHRANAKGVLALLDGVPLPQEEREFWLASRPG